jgi:putative tricarboxylic transport membrane protein
MTGTPKTGERRPDGVALVVAAALAALGALLIWQGASIPDKGGYAGIGSGDVPRFAGLGLLVLAAAHVWTGLRSGPVEREPPHLMPVSG